MQEKYYYANEKQIRGIEEYRTIGGRGDQMRYFHLRNGLGLDATICPDRCLDVTQLSFRGVNFSYLGAVGAVAPSYYKDFGDGFLRSFTGGFFTTCGLANVGNDCDYQEQHLPHHGRIGNIPAENCSYQETDTSFIVRGTVREVLQGSTRLQLTREMTFSKLENKFTLQDTVKNIGERDAGVMLLYHINAGYPLLSEEVKIDISSVEMQGMSDFSQENIATWNTMEAPQQGGSVSVYMHRFGEVGQASVYNPTLNKGLKITFDPAALPCLNQWKLARKYDYVLGLEPGNCFPVGRSVAEETQTMDHLKEDEEKTYRFEVSLFEK